MAEQKTPLQELDLYTGIELFRMRNPLDRLKVEGILERTVKALEAGATTQQIKEVLGKYVSAWQPDRTYG